MRATGIVRRIDDLGRVVIPKEIRRTLRIREGDPLEIFTAKDGEVILKKYSPIGEMNEFAQEYSETLAEHTGFSVVITDLDSVISVSRLSKKEYKDKAISQELEDLIESRASNLVKDNKTIPVFKGDSTEYNKQIVMPIISETGDAVGAIIVANKEEGEIAEIDEKLIKVAASFLGKQVQ